MTTNQDFASEPGAAAVPVPVVAIGASAGGVEAVSQLLTHLSSTTGFAFVYIQHLDPNQESKLSEILGRVTPMPVREAEEQLPIEPNHVYIIPPDQDLEIVDGVLILEPRQSRPHIHMPIDQFFGSLAERQKEGAIGIVLSGAGSDGTQGLKAIKAAGGITFAQDESARFQGLPKSAIAEGVADQVLAPAEIAKELERLSQKSTIFRKTLQAETDVEAAVPEGELRLILQFLRKVVNVDFSHYKMTTIRRRILRRMVLFKLETMEAYVTYLKQNAGEVRALYGDLLINVTSFFRDPETMDYVKKVLFPQIVNLKADRESIRIWVPACSTGQEAYSLAMLLLEMLGSQTFSVNIQIFATDLSEAAVATARLGSYSPGELLDVSPARLQRFFTRVEDRYRINKTIRDLCVFAPHNVLKDPPFSRIDLISCRNLLIYLDVKLQQKLIDTFHYALNPSGFLLLGKSETVGASTALFSQLEKPYKVYNRRNDVVIQPSFDRNDVWTKSRGLPPALDAGSRPVRTLPPANDLEKMVETLLLADYVPPSVVVNEDLDILHFRGSTGLFLEPAPGKASLNLLKMARPALVFELRNAVHKANKTGAPARKDRLDVEINNKQHLVSIEAVPLSTGQEEKLFLILFEEVFPQALPEAHLQEASTSRIKQLEEALTTLREDMHSIIEEQEASNEELQSANEEIISSNEELQSINEELETSKEEIESTNEELLTINHELQVSNDQLSESYEFAETIFNIISEATLVLDKSLRVRSANRAFYRMFQVDREATEGRLIYELGNRQWDTPQLRTMLENIITQDLQFQEYEVTHQFNAIGEKAMRLNARKVIQHERQEAILLAIEDITEYKQVQRLLEERQAWFNNIIDKAPALIWVAGPSGRHTFLNKMWIDYTGRTLETEIGYGWAQGIHPDDRDAYLAAYTTHFKEQQRFSFEYRLCRSDGEYQWMLENAEPIYAVDGAFDGYIGTCSNINLQKSLTQELDWRVQQRTQELAHSQRMLEQAESIAHLGSYEYEVATDELTVSSESYRLLGYEPYSVRPTFALIDSHTHPDDLPRVQRLLMESVANGQSGSCTRRIYRVDGTMRYIKSQNDLVFDEAGKVIRYVGVGQDITEQILAQERVQQSEKQLRTLVDNTPDMITRWDKDLKLLFANYAFERKMGSASASLVGKTSLEILQPEAIARDHMDKLTQVFNTRQPVEHYNVFPTLDGPAYFYSSMVPEFAEDGTVQSVLAIARNITDVKRTEEQLHQTAENLQAVLDSSPTYIAFLKGVLNEANPDEVTDFYVAVCNQKFAQLKKKSAEQVMWQSVQQFEDLLLRENPVDILRHVFQTGEPFYEEHFNPGDPDGQWLAISVTKFDGGVVLTGLDITALRQAEQRQEHWLNELEESNENMQALAELRQQIRDRGEFLRSASHDLRGSFSTVQGAATLLDMVDTQKERAQMQEMLQRNIRQATEMLTQLLDFARLEAGQETIQLQALDAADLLRDLCESAKPLADERGLWLRTQGESTLPVEGDAGNLRRIAQNLVLNAMKYTRVGGVTVRWGAEKSERRWWLKVEDTGSGLSEQLLRSLQEPSDGVPPESAQAHPQPTISSYQLDTKSWASLPGEGIGLQIVCQLINLLDGRLTIESSSSAGTVFVVSLPVSYP